jgi:hypothetical protein
LRPTKYGIGFEFIDPAGRRKVGRQIEFVAADATRISVAFLDLLGGGFRLADAVRAIVVIADPIGTNIIIAV